ncbi:MULTISPECIES: GNAT family N-acetyltransferase [Clavibacter]|uniref:GNAT family N-acetyltransferase n=2 Tax=Clavibacter TaxID=1573 RepID=A0A399P241_9MICO|nr:MULTISPECIES: GNAT family N-acetyltransferase [Clavibacter]RII98876.1 GNAT family N-acetyltransferase [Clavibacter michiganensis]UKF25900.1 GNAT family N-acetyltransferase [Clavibacter sp. A6099]
MSALPLSRRIDRPDSMAPAPLVGIRWRPVVLGDVDALVQIGERIAEADHPDWVDTREDILEELGHSYMDLASDSLAAVTEDGEIVAWGLVIHPPTQETLVRSILTGGVDPTRRGEGIGRSLLAWQHSRALQQLAGSESTLPGWVVVAADERASGAASTLRRAGFAPNRWFQNLARTTTGPLADVTAPDGIRIVEYGAEHSEAAHAARDAAFRGHGSSQPMSDEQWDSMTSLETFDHGLSFLALDDADRVVGLLLTLLTEHGADGPSASSGYVWVIGVVPDARHRGVARALLAQHLRSANDAGVDRSVLDVATDGDGTGLELFEGLGYVPQTVSVNYAATY